MINWVRLFKNKAIYDYTFESLEANLDADALGKYSFNKTKNSMQFKKKKRSLLVGRDGIFFKEY